MYRIYLLSIFAFILQIAWSQNYLPVERFTTSKGLPGNEISCLYEDKLGFIWVGTNNGLCRYDGYSFEIFSADLSDHTALPGTHILKLFEDPEHQLWVLSDLGLSKFIRAENAFQSYFIFPEGVNNRPPLRLRDAALNWKENQILLLGEGNLYILSIDSGDIRELSLPESISKASSSALKSLSYNGLTNTFYLFSSTEIFGYELETDSISAIPLADKKLLEKESGIRGLVCDVEGECWLYTSQQVWHLDRKGEIFRPVTGMNLPADELISIRQSESGWLEMLTSTSLKKYDLRRGKISSLFEYKLPQTEPLIIQTSLRLKSGIFFLGTTGGIYQFNEHSNGFQHYDLSNMIPDGTQIMTLAYDRGNQLWIGTESGILLMLDEQDDSQKLKMVARGKLDMPINFLQSLQQTDTVLLASDNGLFQLSRRNTGISFRNIFPGSVKAMCDPANDSLIFVSGDSLVILSYGGKFKIQSRKIDALTGSKVVDIFKQAGFIFILQTHQLIKYSLSGEQAVVLSLSEIGLNALPANNCFLPSSSSEIIVGTSMGMYIFYSYDFKVLPSYIDIDLADKTITAIIQDTNKILWFTTQEGLFSLNRTENQLVGYSAREGLKFPGSGFRVAAINAKGKISFSGRKGIVGFYPDSLQEKQVPPRLHIKSVELISRQGVEKINLLETDTLRLKTRFTLLRFYSTVLDFWNPKMNYYQYTLSEINGDESWSDNSSNNIISIPRLKAGNYSLKVKGSNSKHVWNTKADEIVLVIIAPFWRSRMIIFAYIAVIVLIFYFSIYFTTRQLRKLNREYRERELIAKKVEQQKEELTQKNKNITDSINYAKRIQMALMPSQRIFSRIFHDSFILHIPKDIVSGDFYWINEVDGRIYFAAVDCTGHGVPGAFMSIIGFELFRRITEIEKKKRPAEILSSLSQGFETIFRDIEDITLRDGMDVAFCAIDPAMKVLEFAGAFNPLYLIRDNTISEIKGDRFSVGLNQGDESNLVQNFQEHVIQLKDGDILYIFTDGYADQFGGPEGKKYKYRRFRHLLLALHQLPMDRQVEFLRRSIMDWKGNLDQVDDILVMGIRIKH